ncbi:MAG: PDZ domain-containing protein [Candidatus Cloacimonadales bacterium]|nr:PDZ domain-containing protein [Candidatus Cloacimonadales bacterium]
MKKLLILLFVFLAFNLISQEFIDLPAEKVFQLLSKGDTFPEPVEKGSVIRDSIVINDSLTAPFAYYIPSGYDAAKLTPLFVYLHGGIETPTFYSIDDLEKDNEFIDFANENNLLLLLPMANIKCMWWNVTGAENILNLIKIMKQKFNVDDNRVYVSGISDGGSGSFHLAMTHPDAFASFYPIIGMMSVGNLENGRQTYPANLANRFVAAVNNDKDRLYPAAKMRLLIDLAQKAGADLFYQEIWGFGHEVPYLKEQLNTIFTQMDSHPRDPFHPQLYWEVSEEEFKKCDWLEITKIDTLLEAAEWHKSYNVKLTDDRLMFGFNHDEQYTGDGTFILKVVENSAADKAGLQVGNVIIKMDGKAAANVDSLISWRDAKQRGDEFTLTVLRNDSEIFLEGHFPESTTYDAFNFTRKSGAVKARYYGNHFEIETSRVKEIAIYFHPNMINLKNPITVNINGKKVFEDLINYDKKFIISNFEKNKDRKALWINKLVLEVPREM